MNDAREADAASRTASVRRLPLRSLSLAIVAAVALYAGSAGLVDTDALGAAVAALPAALWVQAVTLSLLSYLLRFARWQGFMAALGHRPPFLRHLAIYLAAFALTLTPGKAGETVRSVYLRPYGVAYPHSIAAFVSERLLDLLAVGALASLALPLFPQQRPWMLAALACTAGIVILLRSRLLAWLGDRLATGRLLGHGAQVLAAIRFLLSGRRLAPALPLSLMAWAAQGVSLYLVVQALGYTLPAGIVVGLYCLSILAGAASFIPGGLGATEAAIALLLAAAGLERTDAITASLISRSLTLGLAVGIGMLAMTRIALVRPPQAGAGN